MTVLILLYMCNQAQVSSSCVFVTLYAFLSLHADLILNLLN